MIVDRRALLSGLAGLALPGTTLAAMAAATGLSPVDPRVRPADDFYRHANGPWLATATIPADKSSIDAFSSLADLNAGRIRAILEAAADHPASDAERKFGLFYASLIDDAGRERRGIDPIRADLARIAAVDTVRDISLALAALTRDVLRDPQSARYPGPIAAVIYPDIRQPTRYLPTLTQGGIGLPDRDDFISDKPAAARLRDAYRRYLRSLFGLAGLPDPDLRAAESYAMEERIARAHRPLGETFDLGKRYNPVSVAQLAARAPGLDWPAYLGALGFADAPTIMVADPDAIAAVAAAVRDRPPAEWQSYLAAQALSAFAPFGPQRFVSAHFSYAETALKGVPVAPPPWRRAADAVDKAMGPAVGAVYLRRHFPPAARAAALALTGELRQAMARRIDGLAWMSPTTKARAQAKLAAVRVDIGGEVAPREYSRLQIVAGEAWQNVVAAARHNFDEAVGRLGRPLDRGLWDMLPHTVNAQSNPILNKIMFPAGIMQPPLFDATADPAVNYGAIGMFIGHELSHLFDNIGAMFDEHGQLSNWWQPEDKQHFDEATATLAAQYDAYRPFPDLQLKGRQTLHENVADLGGLTLALDAWRASLRGRAAPRLGGLSGEQRLFLSFAQLWREQAREPALRQMIATGTHSHGEWRVATVRNLDAWYAAFDVGPGDALYLPPERRVKIW